MTLRFLVIKPNGRRYHHEFGAAAFRPKEFDMKKFSLIAVLLSAGILAACGNANQKAESAVDATKAAAGTAADATKAAAGTATDAAKNAAAGAATTAADAAKTATGAAVDATKNAADAAKTTVDKAAADVKEAVRTADGK